MGRCIMVLGTPHSGTSCVAGVLHRLGVNMGGGYFQPGDKNNTQGYYEDKRWQQINKDLAANYQNKLYYDVIQPETLTTTDAERYETLTAVCEQQPIWGFKNPRGCFLAQFIWPYLEDVRLVVTERDPEHSARSIKEHSRVSHAGRLYMTIEEARKLIAVYQVALAQRLEEFTGPVHTINYRRMIATDKVAEVGALRDFCFDGLFENSCASLYERMDHHYG